jgi:hypothetical protein
VELSLDSRTASLSGHQETRIARRLLSLQRIEEGDPNVGIGIYAPSSQKETDDYSVEKWEDIAFRLDRTGWSLSPAYNPVPTE